MTARAVSKIACGGPIRLRGAQSRSTSGCLVRFVDQPRIVLMLSAAHGLVSRQASQDDIVETTSGRALGRLRTWTTFYQSVTADVALIWIDPKIVLPSVVGIGDLAATTNSAPAASQAVRIVRDGTIKTGAVRTASGDLELNVEGIDWRLEGIAYREQIICDPMFTQGGDSGAIAVDGLNQVVGMVVGGRPYVSNDGDPYSASLITPIDAILRHPDFQGRLELVTQIPPDAISPF